jgi:2-polyprenyl-6-methoxyphenol hydroxylase-like FAD-dependent oxidoreductase
VWLETAFDDFPTLVREAVAAALADPTQLFGSPVVEVHAERWSRHKITLIGDAAHAMGPVWAQGAALALEDGLVLAELLAQRSDWTAVGTAFERRRRPRVSHVRAATERMSRLAALPVWLRDRSAGILGPKAYHSAYAPLGTPP